jgi:hypothetical protein
MAPLLDSGYKQLAYCSKILDGKRTPIPVVQLDIFQAGSTVGGAITSDHVPPRVPPPPDLGQALTGFGCLILLSIFVIVIVFVLVKC